MDRVDVTVGCVLSLFLAFVLCISYLLFARLHLFAGVNIMSVRVVARIRPLLKQELDKDTIVTAETLEGESTATVVRLPSPKNDAESFSFQFSSVYEQDATQQQLFDAESAYNIAVTNRFDLTSSQSRQP